LSIDWDWNVCRYDVISAWEDSVTERERMAILKKIQVYKTKYFYFLTILLPHILQFESVTVWNFQRKIRIPLYEDQLARGH